MQLTEKELREAYRRLTARPGHDRSSCFSAAQLVGLARGELDSASRPQAMAHLVRCSDCSRELLLLMSLGEWAITGANELVNPRRRRPAAASEPLAAVDRGPAAPVSDLAGLSAMVKGALVGLVVLILALSVGLLLTWLDRGSLQRELDEATSARGNSTALSLSLDEARSDMQDLQARLDGQEQRIEALQSEIEDLMQPIPDPTIVDLDLRRAERRGETLIRQQVSVPEGARWLTFRITLSQPGSYPSYELEVLDVSAERIWQGGGLTRQGRGTVTISFPDRLLRRGIYHFRFFARDAGERQLVEEFSLELSNT